MNCYVCDEDNWHERPDLNPERLLKICKGCGSVAYHVEPGEEERVREYYRKEYRPAPNTGNLLTTNHKQFYIRQFLGELLKEKGEKKEQMICGDVGSAIGYIPNFLRKLGHKATGCELTQTYRRFSEHFYKIPLAEELPDKWKYDLITIYHVLEHLIEPDKKLAKYAGMLKDDGRIMISCPEWFDILEEASGSPMTSFTHLFHKDHINVFSQRSMKNLFRKCGLVIIKEDHITYGQTYLLRKATADELKDVDAFKILPETWGEVNDSLDNIKVAIMLYLEGLQEVKNRKNVTSKFDDAIKTWARFPDAWLKEIYDTQLKVPEKQKQLFEKAMEIMPNNSRIRLSLAVWLYQQGKPETYKEAIEHLLWLMEHRPNEDVMIYLGWCYALLGQPWDSIKWCYQAAEVNPQKWTEAMSWVCQQIAQIPTQEERAIEEVKQKMVAGVKVPPTPDPLMDKDATSQTPASQPGCASGSQSSTAPGAPGEQSGAGVKLDVIKPEDPGKPGKVQKKGGKKK